MAHVIETLVPYANCTDAIRVITGSADDIHTTTETANGTLHNVRVASNNKTNAAKKVARILSLADDIDLVASSIAKGVYRVSFMTTNETTSDVEHANARAAAADMNAMVKEAEVQEFENVTEAIAALPDAPEPSKDLAGYKAVIEKVETATEPLANWTEWAPCKLLASDDAKAATKERRSRIIANTVTYATLSGDVQDGYNAYTSAMQSVMLTGTRTTVTETQTVCRDDKGNVLSDETTRRLTTSQIVPSDKMIRDAYVLNYSAREKSPDHEIIESAISTIRDRFKTVTESVRLYIEFMASGEEKMADAEFALVNNGIKAGKYLFRELPRIAGMPRGFRFDMKDLRQVCAMVGSNVGVIVTDKEARKKAIERALATDATEGAYKAGIRDAHKATTLGIKVTVEGVKKAMYEHLLNIANKAKTKVEGSDKARQNLKDIDMAVRKNMADALRIKAEYEEIRKKVDAEEKAKREAKKVKKQTKASRPKA